MNDIMLDLETMGAGPDAAIVAIGAVTFDIAAGTIGEHFYAPVDLASSVAAGGVQDPGTVQWWLRQSDAARSELGRPGLQIASALDAFSVWVRRESDPKTVKVWGNGAGFDNVILRRAYERAGIAAPWSHWHDRCYRTIKALHPAIQLERIGTHHNAVDDAESQARHLVELMRNVKVSSLPQRADGSDTNAA